MVKNLSASAGDTRGEGLIPGSGRSPGGENSNPLQYSCLENPMVKGTLCAAVHGITKSWTQLSTAHTHTGVHACAHTYTHTHTGVRANVNELRPFSLLVGVEIKNLGSHSKPPPLDPIREFHKSLFGS